MSSEKEPLLASRKPSDYLPQPTSEELQFLDIVYEGSVDKLLAWLQQHQVTARFCTDCVNYRGQSALELAAGADNVPMVQLLLHLGASQRSVDCALTCAALVGSVAVVSILLESKPVDQGDRRRLCGDLAEGLTPLTAAAQGGYYEIVQMLLQRGHVVTRPHIALCECEECVRVEKTLEGQSLTDSKVRINAYRALSSPAYISQTAQDPILEAFQLYKELRDWSEYEPEFRKDYLDLAQRCSDYAVALLGHCRRREEVRSVDSSTLCRQPALLQHCRRSKLAQIMSLHAG